MKKTFGLLIFLTGCAALFIVPINTLAWKITLVCILVVLGFFIIKQIIFTILAVIVVIALAAALIWMNYRNSADNVADAEINLTVEK